MESSFDLLLRISRGATAPPPPPPPQPPVVVKDLSPEDNADYKSVTYWDGRFEKEDEKEWLCDFGVIRAQLLQVVPETTYRGGESDATLVVGCGNSRLSADMAATGFNVVSIDYSETVIQRMKCRFPELQWRCMNMCDLKFNDKSFPLIVDKAGMDALVADEGKDPWNPPASTVIATAKMVREMARVLRSDGKFVQITFQQPHFRRKYLTLSHLNDLEENVGDKSGSPGISSSSSSRPQENPWSSVELFNIDHGLGYFMFVCTRK